MIAHRAPTQAGADNGSGQGRVWWERALGGRPLLWGRSVEVAVAKANKPRVQVDDAAGETFGALDFPTADHLEVLVDGKSPVRIGREHFEQGGAGAQPRLKVKGDALFLGKHVTTIDGIDLGGVAEVVRSEGREVLALIVGEPGEAGFMAVPLAFVREVSAHIILEPSAQEVSDAQGSAARLPAVAAALARARKRG